ncbi:MAG: hypothetical protein GXP16_18665 [Gammaproteobacteria bacterium]|nr:hypothetical protein [Gammaproteobacteria bacterium]
MSHYNIAWVVVGVCGLLGGAITYHLLRRTSWHLLRMLCVALLVTLFVVPAPVPGYEGMIAPAFVIAIFESFFQTDGRPAASLRILGLALLCVGVICALSYYFFVVKRRNKTSSSD